MDIREPTPPTTLTSSDIAHFVEHGHVTLRQAIDPETAQRMLDDTWAFLARLGIQRKDRSTWPGPGTQPSELARHPTFRSLRPTRLIGAIDDLVGPGRWVQPGKRWGFFRLSWPERDGKPWELTDSWHWDTPPTHRGDALFVLLHIGETLPGGAGTPLVSGSHRALAQYYARLPASELEKKKARLREGFVRHPWFSRLVSRQEDHQKRIAELMQLDRVDADGNRLRVVEALGQPGDATLCHPSIFHATNLNRSIMPRIMRICTLQMKPGRWLDANPLALSLASFAGGLPGS